MSEWLCVVEPALRSSPADFVAAADDFASIARRGTAVSDAVVAEAGRGWAGFEGALADGFGTLLGQIGRSLNDVPRAGHEVAAACLTAGDLVTGMHAESEETHQEAQRQHALVLEARQNFVNLSSQAAWVGRALNDAASERGDSPEADARYQDLRRQYQSVISRRNDESARRDTASSALDDLQARFDRLRRDEDDAHADLAAAIGAADLGHGLDQCMLSDPGRPGIGVVIDMLDAAMISIGDGRGGAAARNRLRAARNSIAGFGGVAIAQRDELVERERVLIYGSPQDVYDYYLNMALENAGIDADEWDPSLGLDHNAHIVEDVYDYYADLYRGGTDHLWWSGMAALIGPSFYGGFQDLETFSDLLGRGSTAMEYVSRIPNSPTQVPAAVGSLTAAELEAELRWYQVQLLEMQKEIFYDMGPAHEAYNDGGMRAIEAMFANDRYPFGPQTIEAWQQIDDGHRLGDQDLIAAGNETLLFREQRHIIEDDYYNMRDRPVTGEVVTYMMTAVGAPSVPGAKSYPELFPYEFDVSQYVGTPEQVTVIPWVWKQDVPHVGVEGTVTVTTPLPDGNIAGFEDRWALIEADTLPTYIDLAANDPQRILDELDIPMPERADDFTIDERWDDIAGWMIEGWDVDLDVEIEAGW